MEFNFENAGAHFGKVFDVKPDFSINRFLDPSGGAPNAPVEARAETRADTKAGQKVLLQIKKLIAKKNKLNAEYCIVCGIGGSILATQAVSEALFGKEFEYQDPAFPRLLFADTIDSRKLWRLITHATDDKRPPLITIVSKSGATTETIANAMAVTHALQKREKNWQKYVVAIADRESKLHLFAKDYGIDFLEIPKNISGRFSAFTSASLFPLGIAGADIDKFLKGARDFAKIAERARPAAPWILAAVSIFKNLQKGKIINNIFVFSPALESFGNWCKQLSSESLGKDGKGFLTHVSIGTSDLHSAYQLYIDGPKNIFTVFLRVGSYEFTTDLPQTDLWDAMVPNLSGQNADAIMNTIALAAQKSYMEQGLPFIDVFIPKVNEKEIGALMCWKIGETLTLGKLMGLGEKIFTQDAVELYKIHARGGLKKLKPHAHSRRRRAHAARHGAQSG